MQSQEQDLIENLFSRLKQAESQSGPRDAAAEKLIQQQLLQQPGAPYYMAQAILIQEAAMKQLNSRVSELESRLQQQQQAPQQSSGGFLAGLFGGGNRAPQPAQQPASSAWGSTPAQQPASTGWTPPQPQQPPQYAAAPAAGRGFLGGALQTAVGVAGGVVMAEMLTSMFHHTQPEEIVNIINEPALPEPDFDPGQDTFNNNDHGSFFSQNSDQPQDNAGDFAGFGSDDFDNGYDDDDDTFV